VKLREKKLEVEETEEEMIRRMSGNGYGTGPTMRQIVWAWVILGSFTVLTLYFGWYGSWLVGWPR